MLAHEKHIEELKATFIPNLSASFNPQQWLVGDGVYCYKEFLLITMVSDQSDPNKMAVYYGQEVIGIISRPTGLDKVQVIPPMDPDDLKFLGLD